MLITRNDSEILAITVLYYKLFLNNVRILYKLMLNLDTSLINEEKIRANSERVWNEIPNDRSIDRLMIHVIFNILRNRTNKAREILLNIYHRTRGANFQIVPSKLRIEEYLGISVHPNLIARKIREGYIELDNDEIVNVRVDMMLRSIKKYVDSNRKELQEMFKDWLPKAIVRTIKSYPPCIQNILNRISSGENVGHYERLVLGIYMININKEIDEIIEIYRQLPNFNERKTRYYLEHIHKNKYKMYSCEKIRQLGLCVANCGINTPLQWKG